MNLGLPKRTGARAQGHSLANFASCQRKSGAYTVKGNAIKCFRSLDYELQIALSGFKWQLFSHRALMASIFKAFSFRAPTKNFRRLGNKRLLQ